MASLAEISVAGGTQTGAHGTGLAYGNLATQIRSMKLVVANGSVIEYGRNDVEMKALALGLGAFGVITQLELDIVPTYNTSVHIFLK